MILHVCRNLQLSVQNFLIEHAQNLPGAGGGGAIICVL